VRPTGWQFPVSFMNKAPFNSRGAELIVKEGAIVCANNAYHPGSVKRPGLTRILRGCRRAPQPAITVQHAEFLERRFGYKYALELPRVSGGVIRYTFRGSILREIVGDDVSSRHCHKLQRTKDHRNADGW